MALTLQSTSMSGYMFLGAGSLAYTHGYWSLWYVAGDIGGAAAQTLLIDGVTGDYCALNC